MNTDEVARKLDLARRSTRLNMSLHIQLDCWRNAQKQALEHNADEAFDEATKVLEILERRV